MDVFFDDLKVEHFKSPIVEAQDYYPFGLTFNSYQRENSVPNRWKFQGQEHIDDLGLNWDSFKWRNHQPDIGRFFNVDPLASDYVYNSPYAFAENRVINGVELEGLEWAPPRGQDGNVDPKQIEAMIKGYEQVEVKASYGLIFGVKTGIVGAEVNLGSKEIGSMSIQDGVQAGSDNKVTKGVSVSVGPGEVSLQTEATTEKGTTKVEVLPGTGLTMDAETTTKTTEATAGFSVFGFGIERWTTKTERTVEGFGTTTTQSASEFNGTANQSGSPTVAKPTINGSKFSIAFGIKIEIGLADDKKKTDNKKQ